jgi:hypothetical protein
MKSSFSSQEEVDAWLKNPNEKLPATLDSKEAGTIHLFVLDPFLWDAADLTTAAKKLKSTGLAVSTLLFGARLLGLGVQKKSSEWPDFDGSFVQTAGSSMLSSCVLIPRIGITDPASVAKTNEIEYQFGYGKLLYDRLRGGQDLLLYVFESPQFEDLHPDERAELNRAASEFAHDIKGP